MPSETLDTLYISFKESGADGIKNKIDAIGTALDTLASKFQELDFGKIGGENTELENKRDILKQIADESKKIKENFGAQKIGVKTIYNEAGSHITNRYYGGASQTEQNISSIADNTKETSESIKKTGAGLLKGFATLVILIKGARDFYVSAQNTQKNIAQWDTAKSLAGLSGNAAENAAVNLAQFGGGRMDAVNANAALSTSLGRLAYGDTSLIQSLGMFGIGGITPRSTPQEIRQKVIDRLKRGDMDLNRANALLSALPFSNADKEAMRSGIDIFKGNATSIYATRETRDQLKGFALKDLTTEKGKQDVYESAFGQNLINTLNKLQEDFPILSLAVKELTKPMLALAGLWAGGKIVGMISTAVKGGLKAFATEAAGTAAVSNLPRTMGGLLAPIKKWGLKAFGLGSILMSPNTAGDAERDRMAGFSEQLKNVNWGAWDIPNSTINNTNSNNTTTNNYNFYQGKTNAELAEEGAIIYSRILDNSGF